MGRGFKAVKTFPIILVFTVFLLSCVFMPEVSVKAQTIRIGIDSDLLAIDPASAVRASNSDLILGFIYQPIFSMDENYGYDSPLFKDYKHRAPLEWVFTCYESIDCRVVKAGLEYLLQPDTPSHHRLARIYSIELTEDNQLTIILSAPWPEFLTDLSREFMPIPTSSGLLGTGPYNLYRWDKGNRVILRAKDENQVPKWIQFEIFSSTDAQVKALLAGDIDVIFNISPQVATSLPQKEVVIFSAPGTRSYFLEMNTNQPPFDDIRVRKAVNMALNIPNALAWSVTNGIPLATIVSPRTFGYQPLEQIGYDLAEAKRLLAEAGYENGFYIELDVLLHRLEIAKVYQQMLKQVGIDVSLRLWPDMASLRTFLSQQNRWFWTAEWDNNSLDPIGIFQSKLATNGSANYGNYSSPTLNWVLEMAEKTTGDRLEWYRYAQEFLLEEVPYVFEYVQEELIAVRSNSVEYMEVLFPNFSSSK